MAERPCRLTTPPLSVACQWPADDADIEGARASTYTVTAEDEGKALKVRVTLTDDAGNEESLTSQATAAVTQPLTEDSFEISRGMKGTLP